MSNVTILEKGFLTDTSKMSYCPYCVEELTNEGRDYKEILKPLMFVKTKEMLPSQNGEGTPYFDEHYECTRCGNTKITADTFSIYYGNKQSVYRAKGIPMEDVFKIWDKETESFVEAKWSTTLNKYVKITEKVVS